MSLLNVNWLAVLVSGVAALVVGFVYDSKPLFESVYLSEVGLIQEDAASAPPTNFAIAFVLALVQAFFLSALIRAMGAPTLTSGLTAGVLAWLGFTATTSGANYLFGRRTLRLWLVENGNHLVTFLVMGAILGVWA